MNAPVKVNPEQRPVDPVYALRDDLARTHAPANAFERMLLSAAAQAWTRLQQARDLERRITEKIDPLEMFAAQRDALKAVASHVVCCERAWRQALNQLEKTQRTRKSGGWPQGSRSPSSHRQNFETNPISM